MTLNRCFDVARRDHHEVGEFVDDHEQVRVGVQGAIETGFGLHLSGGHRLVEVVDVLEAVVRQVVVARVHLLDDPFEGLGGLLASVMMGEMRCGSPRRS